ncbi:H-type small acid-soluble spore protein [Virgibacillus soli]|uniref:Small, acid-soluble spore protein H n=1 Tax=Paracerasibacillus soli TaxID=480284 RepID=A0ABU5CTJ1_9BACI|nr:H-type small acid-soluble spore protein [Virgibacillus soli]MDY0409684.1 H-type small acid-soluble spore protein [Virgibacillus soli]
MNRMRAEEIANSPDLQHVVYNGKRVYIQNVNSESDTARVYYLDDPSNEFDAQLSNLFEK